MYSRKYSTLIGDNGIIELKEESVVKTDVKIVSGPVDAIKLLRDMKLDRLTEEHFYVICLNVKMRVLGVSDVSCGSINSATIYIPNVFKTAIILNAGSVIVAHNHPSGECKPSHNDMKVAEVLFKAGELLGIPVTDNLILGKNSSYSIDSNEELYC